VAPGTHVLAISVLGGNPRTTNAAVTASIYRAVRGGADIICPPIGWSERSDVVDDAIADAIGAGSIVCRCSRK
jgi:hypothetical protein